MRGKTQKVDKGVLPKGKASFHRPPWLSLPLRQQTSRRITCSKPELAMKTFDKDKSSAIGGKMFGWRKMLMQAQIKERCGNLLEMAMVKLPPVDIIGTSMDLNPPPTEILGTCMHSDPKDHK